MHDYQYIDIACTCEYIALAYFWLGRFPVEDVLKFLPPWIQA